MNEIIVRTHKGEYFAGETVYGMVYLKVATPNFTETIHLEINGHEECFYEPQFGDDWTINHMNENLCSPYVDKVMSNPVEMYTPSDPLPVGSYKFPFHYRLKPGLPCSTHIASLPPGNWRGSVTYTVTAFASDELRHSQAFVCMGTQEVDLVRVSHYMETTIKKCFCYDSGRISVFVELDRPSFTTGDTIKLSVKVENNTSERGKSVKCWLKRTVNLNGCWIAKEPAKVANTVYATHQLIRRQDVVSIDAENISYALLGSIAAKENRNWVHEFQLHKPDGSAFPPSTAGKYLKIVYSVSVHVSIPRASDLIVEFPIASILPAPNTSWLEWKCQSWMNNCQMPTRQDSLTVGQSVLESIIFEGLP